MAADLHEKAVPVATEPPADATEPPADGASKEAVTAADDAGHTSGSDSDEPFHADAQAGVQDIEATTSVWTKTALIVAYVMMWIIYFVDSMQQGATGVLTPYVTSDFASHSLTPTVTIMSSIIGGVFKLTLAKILDVFGRPQGYLLSIVLCTLGLVMMAACNGVETYAAAQVFYWVGYNGLGYCLTVFIADTSALKNRAFMLAYVSSPYIITTWLSGPISEAFLDGPGWRWCFGAFTIITPAITTPLFFLFWHNFRKATARGLIPARQSGRNPLQSVMHYAREFDAVGLLLLSGGLAMFLLPFNIYTKQTDGWRDPMIICLVVFGVVTLAVFGAWERWLAPVQFIPYSLLSDRTILTACVLPGITFTGFYIWDSYFSSFLQAVNDLSVTKASYVTQIYNVGSCFWGLVVGLLIRRTGRFKWLALYFAVPLNILGIGLMIHFRQPDVNIGYVVMCQIFIAFAGGTLTICQEMAVMAATSHQYVAVVLAIQAMFSSVGNAIGSTIAAAIWQDVFPAGLAKYLPDEEQGNLTTIYGDLTVQLSYPDGTPTRDAIQRAYGDAQRYMLIAATCIQVVSLVAVACWRDLKVKDMKQVKGNVI